MEYKFVENTKPNRKTFLKEARSVIDNDACTSGHQAGEIYGDIYNLLFSSLYKSKYEKDKCRYLIVCYDNDIPIGSFLAINSYYRCFDDLVFEIHLFVKKEYRGKGIAAEMLNVLLKNTDIKKQYLYNRGPYYRNYDPFFYKNEIGIINFVRVGSDIYYRWQDRKLNKIKAKEEIKIILDEIYKETQWYKVIYSFYRGVTDIRCKKIDLENKREKEKRRALGYNF